MIYELRTAHVRDFTPSVFPSVKLKIPSAKLINRFSSVNGLIIIIINLFKPYSTKP